MIRGKHWAFYILVLASGCLTIYAPSASAKPKHKPKPPTKLLPHRPCKGLLSISDFPGAVSEGPLLGSVSPFEQGKAANENYTTTCEYIPPERSLADPEPKGGGSDILTVYGRQFYQHTKHQDLTVYEPNVLGSPKFPLPGLGTRAYYRLGGKEGDVAEGVLQVRNDLFIVIQEFPFNFRRLLTTVAHELSPTGK
jgi:hypothetical protein